MSTLPEPTEKQRGALDRIKGELSDRWQIFGGRFDLTFQDEVRPGRGHDLTWWIYDNDRMAQGCIDVYGNGDGYGVAEVDWIHGGEECDCTHCAAEMQDVSRHE